MILLSNQNALLHNKSNTNTNDQKTCRDFVFNVTIDANFYDRRDTDINENKSNHNIIEVTSSLVICSRHS